MFKSLMKVQKIASLLVMLALFINMLSVAVTAESNEKELVNYISTLAGVPKTEIESLYENHNSVASFLDEVDLLLENIIVYEQWDNENRVVNDLGDLSSIWGVEESLMKRHINIVGADYFISRINFNNNVNSRSEGDPLPSIIDSATFNLYYESTHTGNIYITKDSTSYGYRHGHVGIVSDHSDLSNKLVAEAIGDRENEEDEVIERELLDWSLWVRTLSVHYPTNTSVTQRETAGFFGGEMSYCTYQALIKKGEAVDKMPRVNCVSLIYLCYLMSSENADYDLLPGVGNSSYLLPAQVEASSVVTLKRTNNGYWMRTLNWDDYDWGY